jgi:hypothetical protein
VEAVHHAHFFSLAGEQAVADQEEGVGVNLDISMVSGK